MNYDIVYINKKGKCKKNTVYVNTNLINKKVNRWTLLDFDHISLSPSLKPRHVWRAQCECGTIKNVLIGSILCGRSKSCGCYYKEIKKKERLADDIAAVNNKISMYRHSANRRGISFELTYDQFYKLSQGDCYYCKSKPIKRNFRRKTSGYSFFMNGIDRIDSNKGYVSDNCVSCCDTCNRAKLDHELKDFLAWIKKVHSNIENIKF